MAVPTVTNRRDFLRGRPLAHAIGRTRTTLVEQIAGDAIEPVEPAGALVCATRRAMACQFEVVLPATMPGAVNAATAALDVIDRLEEQLTVYADSSEVSRINLLAAATPVPVEARLFALFETALRLSDETGGAFDMAAGALIKAWGFFRGPKRVPPADELARVLERVGCRHIVLDREARTIAFRRPGVEINLGAIGKGYALDRAAATLRCDWQVTEALLQGGRSSVFAIGSSPDHGHAGWPVAIAHPHRPGEQIATVWLRDAALGTSGATFQFFEADGRRFGHVLDPRTGWPADGQACVCVIAPTAAEADALSTAFFILGPDAARDYCERRPDVGAVVAAESDGNESTNVRLFGRANDVVKLSAALFAHPPNIDSQP
jgi:thiamine biosynthesis lipoprotein